MVCDSCGTTAERESDPDLTWCRELQQLLCKWESEYWARTQEPQPNRLIFYLFAPRGTEKNAAAVVQPQERSPI